GHVDLADLVHSCELGRELICGRRKIRLVVLRTIHAMRRLAPLLMVVAAAASEDGGSWVSYAGGDANFRLRARWRRSVSSVIGVGVRPEPTLVGVPGSLRVIVRAYDWFGGKTAQ